MSLRYLIRFLAHYKYFAIFPVAVIEGPIITIITGFLVSRGVFSFLGGFLVVFLGDAISDTVYYYIGKGGRKYIHKFRFLGITDERVAKVEDQYERAPWKTMIVAKISYGLGSVFMVASGVSKMSFNRFLLFMGVLNAARSLGLMLLGFYFGRIALRFSQKYLGYYTIVIILVVPLVYLLFKKWKKKQLPVLENKNI
jgi:membrane protein DedA with SNARE-associated domain